MDSFTIVGILSDRAAFQVGSAVVYWYGVMVAAGFLSAMLLMQWRAAKVGVSPERVGDLCFAAMIGGIVGARLFYVAINWQDFASNPADIFRVHRGGLVFFGGFFVATGAVIWTLRRRKLSMGVVADLFALGLPLGQVFGRIGCFINGCCHGRPSDAWFSVLYPKLYETPTGSSLSAVAWVQQHKGLLPPMAEECLPVVPTQLFQSFTNLTIFVVLLIVATRNRRTGLLFALYMMLYAVGRFLNEFNRGDYLELYAGLTIAQVICLLLFPVGCAIFVKIWRAPLAPEPAESVPDAPS